MTRLLRINSDVNAGHLHMADLLWQKALERAIYLRRQHTPKLGTRTFDVLHVANAIVLGCTNFVTYKDRQAALAKATKLRSVDVNHVPLVTDTKR